jgi:hypothetical protein
LRAASIYIVNDLVDMEADRKHRAKRLRPLAGTAPQSKRCCVARAPGGLSRSRPSYLVAFRPNCQATVIAVQTPTSIGIQAAGLLAHNADKTIRTRAALPDARRKLRRMARASI